MKCIGLTYMRLSWPMKTNYIHGFVNFSWFMKITLVKNFMEISWLNLAPWNPKLLFSLPWKRVHGFFNTFSWDFHEKEIRSAQYSKWKKKAKTHFPFCHFMALLSKTSHTFYTVWSTRRSHQNNFFGICVYLYNVLACSLRSPVKQTLKIEAVWVHLIASLRI